MNTNRAPMQSSVHRLGAALLFVSSVILAFSQPVQWVGAINNANLEVGTNWSSGLAPTALSDLVISGPLGMNSANLNAPLTINSLTLDNSTGNLADNVGVRGRATGSLTLNVLNVVNNTSARWFATNNNTNTLSVILDGLTTINVDETSSFSTTGNGIHISGTGGIIKTGGGTLRVGPTSTAANNTTSTFSGGFELVEGTVLISFNSAFSSGSSTGFGTGTLTLSGGTLGSTTDTTKTIGNNVTLNGTINLTQPTSESLAGLLFVPNNASSSTTLAQNSALRIAQTVTYNQVIGGGHGLEKLGEGTLILNAANTYTGLTTASEGTLVLNGSIAGDLNVAAGAILAGSGTVGGDAVIAGSHNPGNSPGIQNFGGGLTYSNGATVNWELNANTSTQGNPTALFDQIVVGGTLDFAGATTLNLAFNGAGSAVDWNDAFWLSSQTWTLYDSAAIANFGNLTLASLSWLDGSGNAFGDILGGSQFSLAQLGAEIHLHYTPIPEPSTYAALGGLVVFGAALWRRRRAIVQRGIQS